MEEKKEEVRTIEEKNEIAKVIEEKIKGKKLVFTDYYYFGIDKRGITHEKVMEIFHQFDKIFAIEIDKLKRGDLGYELFYSLSGNVSFSIATCPKDDKLLIIHAVEYKRSLEKRIKKIPRSYFKH
jgi:hypothetical protein